MKKTIALKIDVTKIDKERLFKGKKGTYLDAVLMYDSESDKYDNNGMIVQSVSKEERENGVRGEILGNAKELWSESSSANNAQVQNKPQTPTATIDEGFDDMDDDLPFAWLLIPFAYPLFEIVNVGLI